MSGLPGLGELNGMGMGEMTLEEMLEQYGRGGLNRGRADAPMFFGEEQDLGTDNIENVKSVDMERAVPGEVLGLGQTEHDDQETPSIRQQGGQLKHKAAGGDTVWRESLMPEEKALLKRYFK